MNRLSPSRSGTPENPRALKPSAANDMIACWQNGRRVLMHSSEVARMMKKDAAPSPSSLPGSGAAPGACSMRSDHQSEPQHCSDERVEHAHRASDKQAAKSFALEPPPIVPRRRALAQSAGWQMLAKRMVERAKHPPRCHKPACRRGKQCVGGEDACYLRAFAAVDVEMQRFLQRNGQALRAAAERSAHDSAQENAQENADESAR